MGSTGRHRDHAPTTAPPQLKDREATLLSLRKKSKEIRKLVLSMDETRQSQLLLSVLLG